MSMLSAEQIAAVVRASYAVTAGRQGFLADPGGWLDLLLVDWADPTEDDHAVAREAIEIIAAEAENAPLPETPADIVAELADSHGIVDAHLDGAGAVHVTTPTGSLSLTVADDEHQISAHRPDGTTTVVWFDDRGRSIAGAIGMLAELAARADAAAGGPGLDPGDLPAYRLTLPTTGHLCLHYAVRDGEDPRPPARVFYDQREDGDDRARGYLAEQIDTLGRCAPADVLHRLVMVERYGDDRADRVIAEGTVRGKGPTLAGRGL